MKGILKVILISMLVTIGAVALFIGGYWLFGGLNQQETYALDLSFSQTEVISSRTFALQVNTSTESVNMRTVSLETSPGGDLIIDYPRQAVIGEPFSIMPVTDSDTGNIHGGVVTLYARYTNSSSNQEVLASCKILIDASVNEFELGFDLTELKSTDTFRLASQGSNVGDLIKVSPEYALMPYRNRNEFGNLTTDSIFAVGNLQNKKIFLALVNSETGELDESAVNFRVTTARGETTLAPIIEVQYTYNQNTNRLEVNSDIDIVPTGNRLGEVVLYAYVCPNFTGQENVNTSNVMTNSSVISTSKSFVIRDYSIDGLVISSENAEVYFDNETILYLNNENAGKLGGINLGVELINNSGVEVDDYYLRNNVFISIESDINDRLTRLDGSTTESGEMNVNYTNIDASNPSSWGLRYYYNDFLAYYNYKNNESDDNKIRVTVTFRDFENEYTKTFYLIPRAREVESIDVNYTGSQDRLTFESGSQFNISENNFIFTYKDGSGADFNTLTYYLPYTSSNSISTIPSDNARFALEFTFISRRGGTISDFSVVDNWCNMVNSTLTFTQGENEVIFSFDGSGNLTGANTDFEFLAGVPITATLTPITKTAQVEESDNLFSFNIGGELFNINARLVKFYSISSQGASTIPYLVVNNVRINSEFEILTEDNSNIIRLEINSDSTLNGIGAFTVIARLINESQGVIYDLGVECEALIYVYENISEILIYNYDNYEQSAFGMQNAIDENSEGKYFYITSSQLETLRRLKESDRLKISFTQDFGDYDASNYNGLVEINENAITFGEFSEVYDEDGLLIGYMVPYVVGEIYSIELDGTILENIFNVRIYVDNGTDEYFYGSFVFNNDTTSTTLNLNVNDLIYNEADIVYLANNGDETTYGNSIDNPLSLRATVTNGEVGWNVINNGETVTELNNLRYGFKYLNTDLDYSVYGIRYNLREIDPNFTLNNVSAFFDFVVSHEGGGLTFKNVPYVDGGILLELSIYVESNSNEFIHYVYDGSGFTRVINEALRQENAAKMYFRLEGFDINITPNEDFVLTGTKDSVYKLFGDDGLFTISGVGSIDYSKAFSASVNSSHVSLSEDLSSFTIKNDFLKSERVTFSFYYNSQSNPLYITLPESDSKVDGYSVMASGAYEINILKTTFDAPSVTPIDEFVSITYLGTSEEKNRQVTLSVLVGSESEDIISITNGNITIKTFVGSREATLRVSIRDDVNASSEDVTVTINSLYSLDNVDISADEVGSSYQINAGVNYNVLFTPNETAEGLGVTLNSVSFEFTSSEEDLVISDINLLMKGYFVSSSNITFLSQDINYEKDVTMTLTFTFSDGGSFEKSFNLTILPNLEFKLSNTANFGKSGDRLLIDKSSVSVMKNGGNILNDNNLTPDKFSFEIDGKTNENIFKFEESGEDLLYLIINYDDPNHSIIPSGEPSLTVIATIIFELTTDYGYTLQFESSFEVLVLSSAN